MNRRAALQTLFSGALACTYVAAFGMPVRSCFMEKARWTYVESKVQVLSDSCANVNSQKLALLERRIKETEARMMREMAATVFGD